MRVYKLANSFLYLLDDHCLAFYLCKKCSIVVFKLVKRYTGRLKRLGLPTLEYRHKRLFKIRSRLNVRTNSSSMRVIDNLNSLPTNVVLASSVNSFKSRLNKHWHGNPLKFEASFYIPGVQPTKATQQRNASLHAGMTKRYQRLKRNESINPNLWDKFIISFCYMIKYVLIQ